MILLDSHCHLNDPTIYSRRQQIVKDANNVGVTYFLCVGWDLESSKKAVEIAHEFPGAYAAVGFHPENLEGVNLSALEEIKALAKDTKVKAIGEIGLDYHWYKDKDIQEKQKEWFVAQIDLANQLNLPISIHARDASGDCLKILQEHPLKQQGVLHCFSGSVETMKEMAKLGFYFGFDGPITYKNSTSPKENVVACSIDRILTETDSPYLSPVPFRGTPNEPKHIVEIEKEMAELRGQDKEELANHVLNNFKNLFHVEQ
jgi:TatD DNase family protein